MTLPTIPVVTENTSVAGILEHNPIITARMFDRCYDAAEKLGFEKTLGLTDALSQRSMRINDDNWAPYKGDFEASFEALTAHKDGNPKGAATLLLTDEWGCSTRTISDEHGHVTMERVLDIRPEIGECVIAAIREGASGKYADLTFPGLIGTAQAMGQEFAAAIHVAPTPKTILGKTLGESALMADYYIDKLRSVNAHGMSPTILLRQVFEQARTYEDAKYKLSETFLTTPIIFHLSGKEKSCIIERLRDDAHVIEGPNIGGTNTWQNKRFGEAWSKPHAPYHVDETTSGEARLDAVNASFSDPEHDVRSRLNPHLGRLWVEMNVATGQLRAQGTSGKTPTTQVLELNLNDF